MNVTPGYTVLRWTQHYRIIDGAIYRDALARRHADGALREVSVLAGDR